MDFWGCRRSKRCDCNRWFSPWTQFFACFSAINYPSHLTLTSQGLFLWAEGNLNSHQEFMNTSLPLVKWHTVYIYTPTLLWMWHVGRIFSCHLVHKLVTSQRETRWREFDQRTAQLRIKGNAAQWWVILTDTMSCGCKHSLQYVYLRKCHAESERLHDPVHQLRRFPVALQKRNTTFIAADL